MLDAQSGIVSGVLPCGHLSAEGKLFNEFVVKEMTGEEEDLLAGQGPILPRLNRVILNCLVSLGELTERSQLSPAVNALTMVDRMVLLICIRRASLGNTFDMEFVCPSCSAKSRASVDLSALEVQPMEEPLLRKFESSLSTGKVIKWHIMDGRDEDWLQTAQKKGKDTATLAMLARVNGIGDEVVDRGNLLKAVDMLKRLTLRERNELRGLFLKKEGSVDTTVEYACSSCGQEAKMDLDVGQPSFFFPAAM